MLNERNSGVHCAVIVKNVMYICKYLVNGEKTVFVVESINISQLLIDNNKNNNLF